jgi:hypothetical protein
MAQRELAFFTSVEAHHSLHYYTVDIKSMECAVARRMSRLLLGLEKQLHWQKLAFPITKRT